MTAPCFVVAGYSLILGDDNAGAYAAVITADKLLKALDIRIAQADAAFGGHGADRSWVMRTMNADAYPAGVQRKEPGTVGAFDYALAVTEIVRPVMRRANLLDAEGNLRRRNDLCSRTELLLHCPRRWGCGCHLCTACHRGFWQQR